MPAPRIEIINAIFDSYLTMRKSTWGFYNEATNQIRRPEDAKAGKKYDLVESFINEASKCNTTEDWMKFSVNLYKIEEEEIKEFEARSIFVKPFVGQLLLKNSLKAIRTYIYSQVKKDKLDTSTPELQGYMSNPEARNETYHEEFFQTFIRKEDHRLLGEKSFQDFADNVIQGDRKSTLIELMQPSASPQSTSSAVSTALRGVKREAAMNEALRAAEAKKKEAEDRSVKIGMLLSEAEKIIENGSDQSIAASDTQSKQSDVAERAVQRTYAEVASQGVSASKASCSDKSVAATVSPIVSESAPAAVTPIKSTRTRRNSVVKFANGSGPTLFSGSMRGSTSASLALLDSDAASSSHANTSGVRRRKTGGGN